MPKLNDIQKTALEIVDFLYFFDLFSLSTLTTEKVEFYGKLNYLVGKLVADKRMNGQKAETYRHYLLCGVEILATYNAVQEWDITQSDLTERQKQEANKQINEQRLNGTLYALIAEMGRSNAFEESFNDDIHWLIEESGIANAHYSVSFRLVAQMLTFELGGNIACHVYRRLINLKILNSSKDTLQARYDEIDNEHVFLRALLFIEFEILRKRLYFKHDLKNILIEVAPSDISERIKLRRKAYFDKFQGLLGSSGEFTRIQSDVCLMDKQQVENYIKAISEDLSHNRIFSNFKGTWISFFGTWVLICEKEFNLDNPIYGAMKNEDSCSAKAEEIMLHQYGFVISARSLKDCYNRVKNLYFFIRDYANELVEEPKTGFISPDIATCIYYHPDFSKALLDVLDEINGWHLPH